MSRKSKYADSQINNKDIKQDSLGKGLFKKIVFLFECLLDVVYPSGVGCRLCNALLDYNEEFICKRCMDDFVKVDNQIEFLNEDVYLDRCIALYQFKGVVRDLVHDLKYKGKLDVADVIAYLIGENIDLDFDIITSVPQSKGSFKKRGYNQSEEIAIRLSKKIGGEYRSLLRRTKETPSQVLLNGSDRWYNVSDAFEAMEDIEGKMVVVVDDVVTTGATLNFCAKALKQKGASYVIGLCFAKTC